MKSIVYFVFYYYSSSSISFLEQLCPKFFAHIFYYDEMNFFEIFY